MKDVRLRLDAGSLETPVEPGGEGPPGIPCPPELADELAVVRSQLARRTPALLRTERPLAEPVDGGRRLADLLTRLRAVDRT